MHLYRRILDSISFTRHRFIVQLILSVSSYDLGPHASVRNASLTTLASIRAEEFFLGFLEDFFAINFHFNDEDTSIDVRLVSKFDSNQIEMIK